MFKECLIQQDFRRDLQLSTFLGNRESGTSLIVPHSETDIYRCINAAVVRVEVSIVGFWGFGPDGIYKEAEP